MTKRNIFKRAASLLLALIIVFSAGVSLAFADAKADSYKYPCIFVHGILGYGDNDKLNSVTPYWGMQYKEDLMKSLNARGPTEAAQQRMGQSVRALCSACGNRRRLRCSPLCGASS